MMLSSRQVTSTLYIWTLLLEKSRNKKHDVILTTGNLYFIYIRIKKYHGNYRSSSSASCERLEFSISTACFQRRETTSGASFEYLIKAATTSLYPGEVRLSNLHIVL